MAAALTLGSSNMNNGPASVQLPTAEPLPAGTVPESALAEIYKLMNEHLGTPS
jgi:hypothetical protein